MSGIAEDAATALLRHVQLTGPWGPLRLDPKIVVEGDALADMREVIRAALVRALTAQQWMVACCWLEDVGREAIIAPDFCCESYLERLAALPTPEAMVAAMMIGEA